MKYLERVLQAVEDIKKKIFFFFFFLARNYFFCSIIRHNTAQRQ